MTKRILVMGLPGSGKTTFSQELVKRLMLKHTIKWFNADAVRKEYNDWDFTPQGRQRQVERMREISDKSGADFAICDFVCPTDEYRRVFDADVIVWLDTINEGRFEDTNKVFEKPNTYTYRITDWKQNDKIVDQLINEISFGKTDTQLRSVVKAYSYRCLGSLTTMTISFFVTGSLIMSTTIGFTELILKPFIYWFHERVWLRIKWGKK